MNNLSKPDKTYRVVQWAAGTVGRCAMRAVVRHPKMELVGLKVFSDAKVGQDIGVLAGLDKPVGINATQSIDDVIASKPDCVLYMQEGFNIDDMCQLLEAGINLVTTRSEFFNTEKMHVEHKERLETACQQGKSSLFATGSSPGFITVVMPLAMLYMSRRLDCLTIDEYADVPATCSLEMTTQVMGFGSAPLEGGVHPLMLEHMAEGFAQSLTTVADACGIRLDGFETKGEVALANHPIPLSDVVVIEKGTVAALRITVAGMKDGKPVLIFRANWYCSRDVDQDWDLKEMGWRVNIETDTPMLLNITFPRIEDQVLSEQMAGHTAHPAVNAVPYVCEAAPGIRTNIDMAPIIPWFGER